MLLIYQVGILCYVCLIKFASLGSPKARLWFSLRRDKNYRQTPRPSPEKKVIWMHASSAGEFEQGRPVFSALRKEHPNAFFVLSFFSPSGYLLNKNCPEADRVLLLPADFYHSSEALVKFFKPDVFILVKYDFWFCLLRALKKSGATLYLISARFEKRGMFFAWYGFLFRKYLHVFQTIFVQDQESLELLRQNGFNRSLLSGDTRADRVLLRRRLAHPAWLPPRNRLRIVCGSVWEADIRMLAEASKSTGHAFQWILAPHEPSNSITEFIRKSFPDFSIVLFTEMRTGLALADDWHLMIVDTVGNLFDLYAEADLAYVGGGFGQSVHNLLEPASAGIPVVFGPAHHGFPEGQALIDYRGGFCVAGAAQFVSCINHFKNDPQARKESGAAALAYLEHAKGASDIVLRKICSDPDA